MGDGVGFEEPGARFIPLVGFDRDMVSDQGTRFGGGSASFVISRGLKNGGYYHVYSIVDPHQIKEHARQKVKEITSSLELLIEKFESDLTEHMLQAK